MTISASMVKELRERTNAPMMDCKAALVETGGDRSMAVLHENFVAAATAQQYFA